MQRARFYRGSWPLETPCKYFNLAIGGGLGRMKLLKKWGRERFYVWCSYSCTISFLVKVLLAKLKCLYIQYAWISIMKKQNCNQNVKVGKVVDFIKPFDHYYHKFNFGKFFRCPAKLKKNLKLKFRSKFNYRFTNHGYLHSAAWKTL